MSMIVSLPTFTLRRHKAGIAATVLKWTAGTPDAHGNAVESWAPSAELRGCAFDPGSTSEPRLAGQDRVIVEPTLYAAYDAPVEPQDRIQVNGRTFTVEGVARRWRSPFSGKAMGCVVTLQEVTG